MLEYFTREERIDVITILVYAASNKAIGRESMYWPASTLDDAYMACDSLSTWPVGNAEDAVRTHLHRIGLDSNVYHLDELGLSEEAWQCAFLDTATGLLAEYKIYLEERHRLEYLEMLNLQNLTGPLSTKFSNFNLGAELP